MKEYKLTVREYTDDPVCLKCLKKKAPPEGVAYNWQKEMGLFLMYCARCGFRWWMEPAYKSWKAFDKGMGDG